METQRENHNGKSQVSSGEVLAFLQKVKALADEEEKAKENKAANNSAF